MHSLGMMGRMIAGLRLLVGLGVRLLKASARGQRLEASTLPDA